MTKLDNNSYRSQSRKEKLYPLKDINNIFKKSAINNPTFLNYKIISDEKNDYNSKLNSPTFLLPQINNKSINASSSRFNNEKYFYNKKPHGRSKSSISEQAKNYNNMNDNNFFSIYNNRMNNNFYPNISDFERENQELSNINKLLDNNISNIQNNFNNVLYNKRNNNSYLPFKSDTNSAINNALSNVAKNEIVQNKSYLYNKYLGKQKEAAINNEDIFHNIIPKIGRYSSNNNNYNIFNDNNNIGYNNNQDTNKYRSFFGTRYNL